MRITKHGMKSVWLVFGLSSLVLGLVGAFLPLLPTVPFILLSAYCFSRSSERLHIWLVHHPTFGPAIVNWYEHGAIDRKFRWLATASIALVFLLSVVFGVRTQILILQTAIFTCVLLFIWTRPQA